MIYNISIFIISLVICFFILKALNLNLFIKIENIKKESIPLQKKYIKSVSLFCKLLIAVIGLSLLIFQNKLLISASIPIVILNLYVLIKASNQNYEILKLGNLYTEAGNFRLKGKNTRFPL